MTRALLVVLLLATGCGGGEELSPDQQCQALHGAGWCASAVVDGLPVCSAPAMHCTTNPSTGVLNCAPAWCPP